MGQLQTQVDRMLAEQASEWVDIMKRPGASDRKVFAEWLKQHDRNASEYLLMEAIDRELGGIDAGRRHSVDALLTTGAPVVALMDKQGSAGPRRHRSRRQAAAWGTAAAAATVALAAWWFSPLSSHGWQQLTTAVGEQRSLELADGSTVHLNTRSRLRVRFTEAGRDLELLSGEALFKVAPDAQRPFKVRAGETLIHALGTQFNVYRKRSGETPVTEVAVLEGKVEVSRQAAPKRPAEATVLGAGETASVHRDRPIDKHAAADTTATVAWQQRRLMFRMNTLADIVTEFNRYNTTPQIRIEDPAARTRRFSGVFDADDPEALSNMLADDTTLSITREGDAIVIRAR